MALFPQLKRSLKIALHSPAAPVATLAGAALQLELSRELASLQTEMRRSMPENPAGYGYKVYSQADEDGVLAFICGRLKLHQGSFVEIGCGDGRENNSHCLLLKGWRGAWIDGDPAKITAIRSALPPSSRLQVVEATVTRENVVDLVAPVVSRFGALDIFSVDVDSNDLQIAEAAVAAFRPKVIVGEYNAKFRYPMKVAVTYEPLRAWQGDDYQGASLAAWVDALGGDYKLVCCNLAGTNAFFVRRDVSLSFGDYPPEQLYQPARFHLTALQSGHPPSLSFLADALREERASPSNGDTQ
jgi:hypothetical protein